MLNIRTTIRVIAFVTFILALSAAAQAQATRTWVSGTGDDVNPCSRTAPCKTFAGAISKTADKGEIDCLDPGGFGTVTITKNITLEGAGTLGSILNASTNGVVVNDSATATPNTIIVQLRNLSLNGAGSGSDGVRFVSGSRLSIENCAIFGNKLNGATSDGIDFAPSSAGTFTLLVKDTLIKDNSGDGIRVTTASAIINATIDNCTIAGNANGVDVLGGTANVSRSVVDANSGSGITVSNGAVVNASENQVTNNGTGLTNNSSNFRISENNVYRNTTGVGGTGTYQTFANNRVIGNTTDVAGTVVLSNVAGTNVK